MIEVFLVGLAVIGLVWFIRYCDAHAGLDALPSMPEPRPALSIEDRAWVDLHLGLARTPIEDWWKVMADAHEYGGVYWMCPSRSCMATPASHRQSGCLMPGVPRRHGYEADGFVVSSGFPT